MGLERVDALVFDYDGVLAPIGSDSPPDPELVEVLGELGKRFKLFAASTRSARFLAWALPRFHGYVAVNGLEVIYGAWVARKLEALERGRAAAVAEVAGIPHPPCVRLEVKELLGGQPAGVALGWRRCGARPASVDRAIALARSAGLFVLEYQRPFAEIYAAPCDKAEGLRLLRAIAGLKRVAYFGDSESDLGAMGEAEVSVFVRNEFNAHLAPRADYVIWQRELPRFLRRLAAPA